VAVLSIIVELLAKPTKPPTWLATVALTPVTVAVTWLFSILPP
jgi:hypothetical protein